MFELTPAVIIAAISLWQATTQLSMYKKLRDRMYECSRRAMDLAREIFDKKKELLDRQSEIYAKLCDIEDQPDCQEQTQCALEFSAMNQAAEAMQTALNQLTCYDTGAGREIVRTGLMLMAEGAINAKVDGCIIEDRLHDARRVLQYTAITTAPSQDNAYAALGAAYGAYGDQLQRQMLAQASGFNASASAFGFSVGRIFRHYRESNTVQTPTPTTQESYAGYPWLQQSTGYTYPLDGFDPNF